MAKTLWIAAVILLFGMAPVVAASAADLEPGKVDPRLQLLLNSESPAAAVRAAAMGAGDPAGPPLYDVIIRGDVDRRHLEALGARVGTVLSGLATARVPAAAIQGLTHSPRVTSIQLAQELVPLMDETIPETDIPELWGGLPPDFPASGHTGNGVILGVIDTGLDVTHPDFQNSNGSTRVLYFWRQILGSEPPPPSFGYGQEWDSQEIDAGAPSAQDTGNGHGTHITGVAAGNGSSLANFPYMGMAPECDLIIVSPDAMIDSRIIDGIAYVFEKADALGKDAVVLIASGKHTGPHDGTDPLDLAVDQMSGPGRIVVAAAGNDAVSAIHAGATVNSPNALDTVSFQIPTYSTGSDAAFDLDGWANTGANFSVELNSPTGIQFGPINVGGSTYQSTADGNVTLAVYNAGTATHVFLRIAQPALGTWTIDVRAGNPAPGTVDFWITDYDLAGQIPVMVQGMTAEKLVRSPATATQAIAVGAYTIKKYWTDYLGRNTYFRSAVEDDIADFSSPGPRRDGFLKPDIAASGYGAASAMASNANIFSLYVLPGQMHYVAKGTSVASAVVAGAVAVLLDEFPGLDPASVKSILSTRARSDLYTGNVPNTQWGHGKLCLAPASGQTAVREPGPLDPTLRVRLGAPYPNPVSQLARVPVVLDSEAQVRVSVFDASGRRVATLHDGLLPAGEHVLEWDGLDESSRPVASGRYYIVAVNDTDRRSRALVVLR